MSTFLGHKDCIENLRRDLVDLQGAILEVFSRTGPVRCPSWKFPDKLSCNLDLVSLLEEYDFVDGEDEFSQNSHIVLLELVIDRLLLLLQSYNIYAEQLVDGHKTEPNQQKGCVSVGLVVKQYWKNVVQLGRLKGTCKDIEKQMKTINIDCNETSSSQSPHIHLRSTSGTHSLTLSSTNSFKCVPRNHANAAVDTSSHNDSCCPHVVPTDTRNVSCQTVQSSIIPCDACYRVQSLLRQTGEALAELCQSEGLPSSLQQLIVSVEDSLSVGHLPAGDLAQWSRVQCRDMERLRKHLEEVRGTVLPLRDGLSMANRDRDRFRSQFEDAQQLLKQEMTKNQASIHQMNCLLQEAQISMKETERRLKEEQQQRKTETLSLKDSNSILKEKVYVQHETLHTLEHEKNELQEKVKTLQLEEEAHRKLQERTQLLEKEISEVQLLLDKESAKYKSACRQQEAVQSKQKSLSERVDSLDQECEDLQRKLGDSEDMQAELQVQVNRMSKEKEQLLVQFTQQQDLCSELQREKQSLGTKVEELNNSVTQLRGEVQDLIQRERLLVAFPELSPMCQTQPQSTGDVLLDMEQQLQANTIRIKVLEQENVTLHNSLVKIGVRDATKIFLPEETQDHLLRHAPGERQPNHRWSSSAEQLKYNMQCKESSGDNNQPIGPWDHVRAETAPASSVPAPSLLMHRQTLNINLGTNTAKTYAKVRPASMSRCTRLNHRKY